MTDVTASIERAPRTVRKSTFFHAEPIARWLSAVLVLYALLVLAEDLHHLAGTAQGTPNQDARFALASILSMTTVGLIAWRSTWASVASIASLVISLIIDNFVSALFAGAVITLAVLATATPRFIAAHLAMYSIWIVLAAVLGDGPAEAVFWNLFIVLLPSTLVGAGIRHFRQQRQRNEQRVRDLEVLNVRLREDERQALARDLHDVVAHELTLITMQTMSRRRSEDVGELHQVVETVEDAARSALHELRVLLRLLRDENDGEDHPRDVTGAGLAIGSLEHVVTSLAASLRDLRFEPDVQLTGDLEAMPTTVRGTAARILQEAVTNIIKYAPRESRCLISVTADEHELRLRVTNPLPGSKPAGTQASELSSGLGLRGITERVSLLGGRAQSGPEDGQWVLDVSLPMDGREAL
ncbi:sensor histidine kinase [Kocuria sp. CPCC 205300]|uniref:sensor histidine kinase n=1 Tax=Kocuria sabuli TaxID=3071448 RepID=UPI0036DB70C0